MIEESIKLPDEEALLITAQLRKVIPHLPHPKLIVYVTAIALENARLVFEVNRLREQLGIAPMKKYKPGE